MIYRTRFAGLQDETRPSSLFDALPRSSARAVEQWLDALQDLPLDAWFAVTGRDGDDQPSEQEREVARRAVIGAIAGHGLEVTAWFIKDMVATAAYNAMRLAARTSSRGRSRLAAAQSAAEWAALAVAAEPWLEPAHVAILCDPMMRAGLRPTPATSRLRARRPTEHFVGDQPSRSRERED
jgi:hypothetical protein